MERNAIWFATTAGNGIPWWETCNGKVHDPVENGEELGYDASWDFKFWDS